MSVQRFEVEFRIVQSAVLTTIYAVQLSDVTNGFWITSKDEFTKGSDAYMFILPHMINYIRKVYR